LISQLTGIQQILIVQQTLFGDVLLGTSYLEALHNRFPEAAIDFFVSKPFDQVVEGHPFIRTVITSPSRRRFVSYCIGRLFAIVRIIGNRYDLVIDQQGNAGSAIIMMVCGARYRLGWKSTRGGKYFCNIKATPGDIRYHGNRNFDILSPLGISEQPYRLHVAIKNESHEYIASWLDKHAIKAKEFICMSTRSAVHSKQWDEKSFLRLIDLIASDIRLPIVLTYAPDEETSVRVLAGETDGKALPGPATTYNQVAALLSSCKLLICHDGGLNHLSVATGTPSIAIF
jgi:ADP-heptose:LPS heptosyltransferase